MHKLEDRVEMLGEVKHSEVLDRIVESDYLISLYDVSNLGNPVLEANYLGLKVITFKEKSLLNILDSETTIYLDGATVDNISELASKIIHNLDKEVRATSELRSWEKRMRYEIVSIEKFTNKDI